MAAPFQVDTDTLEDGIHELRVEGELDHATAPQLEGRLADAIDAGATAILVNLNECVFIDSTGLGLLMGARERLDAEGNGQFSVCCPHAQVRRLLELTGIGREVELHETRDAALAALRA